MNTQTVVMLTPEELQEMIAEAVKNNTPKPEIKPDEELMTRQEVADLFRISLVTLRSWNMRGLIKSLKVGGRRYYRKHEVENLIHEKYKR